MRLVHLCTSGLFLTLPFLEGRMVKEARQLTQTAPLADLLSPTPSSLDWYLRERRRTGLQFAADARQGHDVSAEGVGEEGHVCRLSELGETMSMVLIEKVDRSLESEA